MVYGEKVSDTQFQMGSLAFIAGQLIWLTSLKIITHPPASSTLLQSFSTLSGAGVLEGNFESFRPFLPYQTQYHWILKEVFISALHWRHIKEQSNINAIFTIDCFCEELTGGGIQEGFFISQYCKRNHK